LDLPGIIEGAKDGKGRGKQVIAGKHSVVINVQLVDRILNLLSFAHRDVR
jgi:ribosome-interacting GTPase 1